MKIDQEMQDL